MIGFRVRFVVILTACLVLLGASTLPALAGPACAEVDHRVDINGFQTIAVSVTAAPGSLSVTVQQLPDIVNETVSLNFSRITNEPPTPPC